MAKQDRLSKTIAFLQSDTFYQILQEFKIWYYETGICLEGVTIRGVYFPITQFGVFNYMEMIREQDENRTMADINRIEEAVVYAEFEELEEVA